ncbi:MAG: YceD family protein [Rhizomicrobium sp.]|jgi:uncharacterized metal-binding protein YceD (DUF177 family)
MNDERAAPIRHFFDLGDLSQAGSRIEIVANGDDLARLAHWAGVDMVHAFGAQVELSRLSRTRFSFEAEMEADIVQSCVVTLDPVAVHIGKHVTRELHFSPHPRAESGELTLSAGDEDVPEEIASLDYDLAAPLLEEFLLAIDPYPRKEGVTFEPPAQKAEPSQSPFAVLKRLNEPG